MTSPPYPVATPDTEEQPPAVETAVTIHWDLLMERRPAMLAAVGNPEFSYLLMPEVRRLLEAASDLTTRQAIAVLWYTGVRVSELVSLRVYDVHHEQPGYGFIVVRSKKKRGKQHDRALEIEDPWFWELFVLYKNTRRLKATDWLLPSPRDGNKALNTITIWRWIRTLSEALQFPITVGPHTLRHSFGINATLHGRSLKVIQAWLGHSDARTTEIYTRCLSGDVGFQMRGIRYR